MASPSAPLLAALRGRLQRCERPRPAADLPPISAGAAALDQLLPWGGLRPGSLVEYLAAGLAQGAAALALAAARAACREGRMLVIADRRRQFHPPAAAAWGIELARTVIVRPASAADELWAVDQALRCGGVGAVCAWCGAIGGRDFRRLQLAAESGGTLGLFLRPAQVRGQPTWSDAQFLVEPQPAPHRWRLRVELLRCRGAPGGRSVLLELNEPTAAWDAAPAQSEPTAREGNSRLRTGREASRSHATHLVPPPAELADPAAARRRSRA